MDYRSRAMRPPLSGFFPFLYRARGRLAVLIFCVTPSFPGKHAIAVVQECGTQTDEAEQPPIRACLSTSRAEGTVWPGECALPPPVATRRGVVFKP